MDFILVQIKNIYRAVLQKSDYYESFFSNFLFFIYHKTYLQKPRNH